MSIYDTEGGDFEPLDKYITSSVVGGSALSLPEEILHGAVATVADIGTTYWNSLMPERYETSTVDLLSRIDEDALQVYNEHTDLVQAASFVGGLVMPVGLSLKGMKMLRDGTKGYSWFSNSGQAAQLGKVEAAFARAGADDIFKTEKYKLYGMMAANAVADNVAAEVAVVGALSSHPFMEDYTKDFGTNFLTGVALGSGIQAAFGKIATKTAITTKTAAIEETITKLEKEAVWDPIRNSQVAEVSHTGEAIAVNLQAADNLKALVDEAVTGGNPRKLQPFVIRSLEMDAERLKSNVVDSLRAASQGELAETLAKAGSDTLDHFLRFVGDPRNATLDKIAYAKVAETLPLKTTAPKKGILWKFTDLGTILTSPKGKESVVTDAIYLPTKDAYIGKNEGHLYMTMADLGKSIEDMQKSIDPKVFARSNNPDWAVEVGALHSAVADAQYAEAVLAVSKWGKEDFEKAVVAPDHLPVLKAIQTRAAQLMKEDPSFSLKLRVTAEPPTWDAVQRVALAKQGGLKPTYIKDLENVQQELKQKYALFHPHEILQNVDSEIRHVIDEWVAGSYEFLRNGAMHYQGLTQTLEGRYLTSTARVVLEKGKEVVTKIYNSPQSKAFRAEMQRHADPEGFVWLYRGMYGAPKGHKGVESYALVQEKAAEFGHSAADAVKMYRVHVDDILGTFYDIGPGAKKAEVLVLPPTRDYIQIDKYADPKLPPALSAELTIEAPKVVNVGKSTALVEDLSALETTINKAQVELTQQLARDGKGIETISLLTGAPEEAILHILEKGHAEGTSLIKYSNETDVIKALDPLNRSLALSATKEKSFQARLFSQLDKNTLDNASSMLLQDAVKSSPSETVRAIGDMVFSPDMQAAKQALYAELEHVTSSNLKSTLFASADRALEKMGSLGAIASYIGKQAVHAKNQAAELYTKPMAQAISDVIREGEHVLIDLNTSLAVNAGIEGFRWFANGKFYHATIPQGEKLLRELVQTTPKGLLPGILELAATHEIGIAIAKFGNRSYSTPSKAVTAFWEKAQEAGRELYFLKNAKHTALGRQTLPDIGLWVPSVNPRNKSIAYVYDKATDTTSMLYAETDELLKTAVADYEQALFNKYGQNWRMHKTIVTKDRQKYYNNLQSRHDPLLMQAADVSKRHGGASASTLVATDASAVQDLLQGYQSSLSNSVEDMFEITMSDTMDALKRISDISQTGYQPETKGILGKLTHKPADPGQVVRNVILGRSNLSEHKAWSEIQERVQVGADMVLGAIAKGFHSILSPRSKRTAQDWNKMMEVAKQEGFVFPYEGLEKELGLTRYMSEGQGSYEGLSKRAVSIGNATAATLLLRFMDMAQPFVNAVSLPILTSAAVNRKLASSFTGAALNPEAKFSVAKVMHDGVRLLMHPTKGAEIAKIMKDHGIGNVELREITELLSYQKSFDKGLSSAMEDVLESKFVKLMAKPADMTENMTRSLAFAMGFSMAKQAYPKIGNSGATVFARNFMDEVIGNYTSVQRPAMFQGTVGTAMGLFQTYMLTMAQAMYRQVETKQWKSLGKLLLTQGTVFGAGSLPGFHAVSEAIATHYSDNHIDLETGTFRALGQDSTLANILLYGLPSSFGPGIVTRGDIQPRVPSFSFDGLAAANIALQSYNAMERVAKAAWTADESAGRAILEAISLQSVSRPVARISELALGYSLTSRGDVVASGLQPNNTEQLLSLSTLSRVMATRPLEEIKAREVLHLNTVYMAADADKRKAVAQRLKAHIRAGDLDGEVMEKLAEQYMRTGTSTGWRAAVADAVKQSQQPGSRTTYGKLSERTSLHLLIDDLE